MITHAETEPGAIIQQYLGLHTTERDDRRTALVAAATAADATDDGTLIAEAMIRSIRERSALLPSIDTLDRIGLAGRSIARRRANAALLDGITTEQLVAFDSLLVLDSAIGQTRFGWLRETAEAPGSANLLALIERLIFVRSLKVDALRRRRMKTPGYEPPEAPQRPQPAQQRAIPNPVANYARITSS